MFTNIKTRWSAPGGYKAVLIIAFPLILSTASTSIQHFIDRVFLSWYSPEALAASMPAGLLNWSVVCLFMGTAAYVGTFVAQYTGAKRLERIGPAMWQGIYLSIIMIGVVLLVYPFSAEIFALVGHAPKVQLEETTYFKILMLSAPFVIVSSAISGFFSGIGKTWMVMWVNIFSTLINVVLDYLLIFGHFGFPKMGVAGAAWATTIALSINALVYLVLIVFPKYNNVYFTRSGWRFDYPLFKRLLKYGLPNGWQFFLEVSAFTLFIFMVGKIGITELAATNIALNINMLAFMPMFGVSIAVSILVGQRLGESKPDIAEKATWSAFHMATAFFIVLGISYYLVPNLYIAPFAANAVGGNFPEIQKLTTILLQFVAFYCLFDGGNMVFSGALKGAGDTKFVAISSFLLSWIGMLLPSALFLYYDMNVLWFWGAVTFYIFGLCIIFWWRFEQGKWKSMRVIEAEPIAQNGNGKITEVVESISLKN